MQQLYVFVEIFFHKCLSLWQTLRQSLSLNRECRRSQPVLTTPHVKIQMDLQAKVLKKIMSKYQNTL
jgi:hypothetical protein